MIDLTNPTPAWIRLAEGFGVGAARAETADEFVRELARPCGIAVRG